MGSLTGKRKEELAAELDIVETWLSGPRKAKVAAIAAELRGEEVEEPKVPETPPTE